MQKKLTYEELEAKIEYLEKKASLVENLQAEISSNKQFLQILLDTIPNPVFYKNKSGVYENCNDAFSKAILGIPKERIIGKSLFDLPNIIPEKLAKIYHAKDQTLYDNPGIQVYEGNVNCANNIVKTFLFYKATVKNDSNEVIGIVGVMSDITELKENQIKLDEKNRILKTLSYTDALTGILNRRKFDELFPERMKVSNRYNHILNFVIIDVDNFKSYNDTYGHSEGDNVLKVISNTIKKKLLRPDDYFFRLGGEEFGLLYHSNDEISALKFADNVRSDIEELNIEHINNNGFNKITISLGLIVIKNTKITTGFIYEQADKLLYQAKKSGRNKLLSKVI